MVELLPITAGHQGREHGHGFVVFSRQEEANQVVPEGLTRGTASEEVIELTTEGIGAG
ncbi:MAG: hypothetical protein NVS4B2_28050 [Chloroflexota bacterium]